MEQIKKLIWPSSLAVLGLISTLLYVYTLKIGNLRAHILKFENIYFALFALYLIAVIIILNTKLPTL